MNNGCKLERHLFIKRIKYNKKSLQVIRRKKKRKRKNSKKHNKLQSDFQNKKQKHIMIKSQRIVNQYLLIDFARV